MLHILREHNAVKYQTKENFIVCYMRGNHSTRKLKKSNQT